MSLLFNTLNRFVIAFLTRSDHLLISSLQSPSAVILEPKKRKSVTTSTFSPNICHEVVGPDAMILVFLIFSFKPALSLSFFTLLKRLFSSSLLSAIRVVSSTYLRLLMFLPPILILACNSFRPAFLMMCSEYRLNKWGTADSLFCIRLGLNSGEGNGTPLQYSCLENPMDRGTWWAAVHGIAESDITEQLHFHFSRSCIGEGNGNPLQCSCLENPRDGGAWWAAIFGVAQSWTRLKRLSSSSSSRTKFHYIHWSMIPISNPAEKLAMIMNCWFIHKELQTTLNI